MNGGPLRVRPAPRIRPKDRALGFLSAVEALSLSAWMICALKYCQPRSETRERGKGKGRRRHASETNLLAQ